MPLLQRNGEVEVAQEGLLGEHVAGLEVAAGEDATHQRVEIFGLAARDDAAGFAAAAAHLRRLVERLEPGVALLRQRAVGRNRHAFVIDVDVPLPRACALAVGDQHRGMPVAAFVRRQADDVVGIAPSEIVDLIEVEVAVLGRIERDAMIERERNIAPLEKAHQVVEVLFRGAAGRDDHRAARARDLLQQRPVVHVGAGDLDDRHIEFDAEVDRGLVERRRHRDAAQAADFLDQAREIGFRQLGLLRLLDVTEVLVALEAAMDEFVDVAKLQLDRRFDVVVANDGGVVADDSEAALELAQVIIRQLEHEQVFEKRSVPLADHHASAAK